MFRLRASTKTGQILIASGRVPTIIAKSIEATEKSIIVARNYLLSLNSRIFGKAIGCGGCNLDNPTITIILNGYKRPHTLRRQLRASKNQTIPPNEILLWRNDAKSPLTDLKFFLGPRRGIEGASSTQNLGVWARFAFALMSKSEFVCIIDDDTIPSSRWLENCLSSFRTQPGLYGTIGVKFDSAAGYDGKQTRVGWDNPNDQIERVDIVGHSWFFPKEYLRFFWREFPNTIPISAGEDIHFSYTLQKFAGIGTFVPPHPVNSPELWGSQPAVATKLGGDANATANHAIPIMNAYLGKCVQNGFVLMANETHDTD